MISASQNQHPFPSGSTSHPQASTSTINTPLVPTRSRSTSLHQRPTGTELSNVTNTPDSRNLSLKPSYRTMAVAELLTLDNLPDVPDDLKTHVAAYIQRARELASKDPVMCYWCLYFAAKRGVGARTSRSWLFKLMDTLELVKREMRDDAAVASEGAGHAYIENFALKVFELADSEDQSGHASRSTAKKFLAAANFLEMLSVFDTMPEQQENIQKIKYAKWKAAAIARDVRSGGPSAEGKQASTSAPAAAVGVAKRASLPAPAVMTPAAGPSKPSPASAAAPAVTAADSARAGLLAPPQQRGGPSPSVPSSFGSLPASATTSTNASPSGQAQVPLPVSPAASTATKLPSPKHPAQTQTLPAETSKQTTREAPRNNVEKSDAKPTNDASSSKAPLNAPPPTAPVASTSTATDARPNTNDTSAAAPRAGFFASIAGRVFGTRDGQTTPGAWSNQATPGTEDTFRLPIPGPPPLPASTPKADKKEILAPVVPKPPAGRSPLGASSPAGASSTLSGDTTPRASAKPFPTEARPEIRRAADHSPSPLSSTVVPSSVGSAATAVKMTSSSSADSSKPSNRAPSPSRPPRDDTGTQQRKADPSPTRSSTFPPSLPTSQLVNPSGKAGIAAPAVAAQLAPVTGGMTLSRRRYSDDKSNVPREDVFPLPSRIAALERDREADAQKPETTRAVEPASARPTVTVAPAFIPSRLAALKKVHFSGSVIGGLSSVASTSPPPSPIRDRHEFPSVSSQPPTLGVRGAAPRRARPLSVSDIGSIIPVPLTSTSRAPVRPENGSGAQANISSSLSRQQPEPSKGTSAATSGPPKPSKMSSLPVTVPGNRQRAQSFGQPSSAGSVGSWTTLAANNTVTAGTIATNSSIDKKSPRPSLPQILPLLPVSTNSTSPQSRPMTIPPISKTLPGLPAPNQQPTPSPSPPNALPKIPEHTVSTSPISYTAVPAAKSSSSSLSTGLGAAVGAPKPPVPGPPTPPMSATVPAFPASSSTASLTGPAASAHPPASSRPTASHISTPFNGPDELPSLSASVLGSGVMLKARKHTKYAMSALEFDDVETARRELRLALEALDANHGSD